VREVDERAEVRNGGLHLVRARARASGVESEGGKVGRWEGGSEGGVGLEARPSAEVKAFELASR